MNIVLAGRGRPVVRRAAFGLLAAAGLLAGLLLADFGIFVRGIVRAETGPTERADAVVALTGGAERIGDAARLLADGYGRRLLITGVHPRTSAEDIARREPRLRPLLDCCVDVDHRAMNTVGNAFETADWARRNAVASVIVVTSSWHMPRTMAELRAAAPDLRLLPFPVVTSGFEPDSWRSDLRTARLLAVEYAKYRVVMLRGFLGLHGQGRVTATGT
jgi:uncharacterized SAM-binding protein YcdF (DUF218 family)